VSLLVLTMGACASAPGPREPARTAATPEARGAPDWQPWSRQAFESAAREDRLIMVSVQADWCHWCHVMNDETFADPRVVRLLAERFVVIRVDSDARPDLAGHAHRA
jgi:uncharacterized protein